MSERQQPLRDQGVAAFRGGRTDEAIRLLRQAVAADPRDHRAYSVLGAAHIQRGEYDEAIQAFENARGIRPDSASIHYNLGLAYQRSGRPQQAVAAFEAALEVDSSYEKARAALDRARAPSPPAAEQPPPTPAQPPSAGTRMPTAPPPAPWQTEVTTTQAKGEEPVFELRPLGGEGAAAPRKAGEEQAEGGAQPAAEEARPEPTAQRPRRPSFAPGPEQRQRRVSTGPALSAHDSQGMAIGIKYGVPYMLVVALFDHWIQSSYGLFAKTGITNLFTVLIVGVIMGVITGVLVGITTVRTRNPAMATAGNVALWVLIALILLTRAGGGEIARFLIGVGLGAGYGGGTGWLISTKVALNLKGL